uniref:MITD1 C-terminal phospholipase D-like domain-containing protein n=1 Tax=Graphocephala atropunctata TaxID=36148 RepID=A0A1B6KZI5_9HEMI
MGCAESSQGNIQSNGDYANVLPRQIEIRHNSVGNSYQSIFGEFLTSDVTLVLVQDPYIRTYHQCQNLVRLCELMAKKCPNLRTVQLLTSADNNNSEQGKWLRQLQSHLSSQHKISLTIQFNPTLHDRQIKLSNGWIIKIGRGLDYFKPPAGKFSLGYHDLDWRPCLQTTVDIFHS